jgi:hypothetical protein
VGRVSVGGDDVIGVVTGRKLDGRHRLWPRFGFGLPRRGMLRIRCASDGQVRIAAVVRDNYHRLPPADAGTLLGHTIEAELVKETS